MDPALRRCDYAAAASDRAHRRRRDERGDDDEHEGEGLDARCRGVAGHRVAEDDDAAEDAGDVGGGAR